jgi:hypothetical protein
MDMDVIVPIVIVLVVAGFFFWKKKGNSADAPVDGENVGGGGKPTDTKNQQLK